MHHHPITYPSTYPDLAVTGQAPKLAGTGACEIRNVATAEGPGDGPAAHPSPKADATNHDDHDGHTHEERAATRPGRVGFGHLFGLFRHTTRLFRFRGAATGGTRRHPGHHAVDETVTLGVGRLSIRGDFVAIFGHADSPNTTLCPAIVNKKSPGLAGTTSFGSGSRDRPRKRDRSRRRRTSVQGSTRE